MKKRLSDIFSVLAAAVLLLLCAALWLPKAVGGTLFYISSDSMAPAVPKGSLAFIELITFEQVEKGDVLVFKETDSNKSFMHRVTAIYTKEQLIYTKGDANAVADPLPTSFSCCRGREVFHVPLLGYAAQALDTFVGKAVIVLFYIVWLAVEIERLRANKKKEVSA